MPNLRHFFVKIKIAQIVAWWYKVVYNYNIVVKGGELFLRGFLSVPIFV